MGWLSDGADEVDIACGAENPPSGWYSPGFGQKQAICTAILSGSGKLPVTMATVLAAGNGPLAIERISETGSADPGSLALRLVYGDRCDLVRFEDVDDSALAGKSVEVDVRMTGTERCVIARVSRAAIGLQSLP